jgi:uncharacterized lipoprotein YmbA
MQSIRFDRHWILTIGLLMIMAGCRSTVPVTYYTLKAAAAEQPPGGNGVGPATQAVGIGPLSLPDYLDRPQLVTFAGPNRLEVAEFHRWAGTLKQDMARVIAQNVSVLLNNPDVVAFPWDTPHSPGCQVILDFRQIEGRLGQAVEVKAVWWITMADRPSQPVTRQSDIREPTSGPGYDALVAAYSQALLSLSRQIVDAIGSLPTMADKAK